MDLGLGALLGVGSSLLGASKTRSAQKKALQAQQAAAAAAQERLAPYEQTGQQANDLVQQGLATGTLGGSFVPSDLSNDPGYQFRLAEGQKQLDRLQSARGILDSGEAIKQAQSFGQGLADQTYNDAYNRWLQEQQNRNNILTGQQQLGYGAAAGGSNIDLGVGNNQAQYQMGRNDATLQGIGGAVGGLSQMASGFGQAFAPAAAGGGAMPFGESYGAMDPNLPWKSGY